MTSQTHPTGAEPTSATSGLVQGSVRETPGIRTGVVLPVTPTMHHYAQGRQTQSTEHRGRISKRYWSQLSDRRIVSLSYPDYEASLEKFYGPASISVSNLAGQSEASGSVAISGGSTTTASTGHIDETQSDLIAALDVGTLASLSTQTGAASGDSLGRCSAKLLPLR